MDTAEAIEKLSKELVYKYVSLKDALSVLRPDTTASSAALIPGAVYAYKGKVIKIMSINSYGILYRYANSTSLHLLNYSNDIENLTFCYEGSI